MSEMQQTRTSAKKGRWPLWLRRGRMENTAIVVIALGVAMMVQPFSIDIYGWSFAMTLTGVLMFTVVSKFPE